MKYFNSDYQPIDIEINLIDYNISFYFKLINEKIISKNLLYFNYATRKELNYSSIFDNWKFCF